MKKKLPLGIEDFDKIIKSNYYYVDKTGLIKELIENRGMVNWVTRPYRFGKSLNMSMLKCFLEIGCDRSLFDGLMISKEKALCEEFMGKFPVVHINMKEVKSENFTGACIALEKIVVKEALRFYEQLSESNMLNDMEKKLYFQMTQIGEEDNIQFVSVVESALQNSIKILTELLHKHYKKRVVVLIDEYDVPLKMAYDSGYYEKMDYLIQDLFNSSLKTNDSLAFAVIMGCLRMEKPSIITGFNNFNVMSVSDVLFDEYFGFTNEEVKELLAYYDRSDCFDKIKEWYDGYQFGNVEVYCPWDVVSYCFRLRVDKEAQPQNFWINTSSNDAVKKFLQKAEKGTIRRELEKLVAGEVVTKEIHQELTYRDMYASIENIWSLLFTTGYLTQRGRPDGDFINLAIPNLEIRNIFAKQIMECFKENVQKDGETLSRFCEALESGAAEMVESLLEAYLKKTISIRDTFVQRKLKENFYHGILLGILGVKEEWDVSSNRETGDGYSDIFIETDREIGIIIEVKYAHDGNLEAACREALAQIQNTRYEEELREDGIETILKYGIACCRKHCRVILEE